jgi:2-polyprenyl-3-methyl-5-hydroxy-6-metoxy-1,4-benzoquinol methylase
MEVLIKEIEYSLMRLGNTEAIKNEALAALQIQNDHADAYKTLAVLSLLEGKNVEAQYYAEQALQVHPTNMSALRVLAEVNMNARRYGKAIEFYNEIIQLVGKRKTPSEMYLLKDAAKQIADHYFSVGELQQAVECYRSIGAMFPDEEFARNAVAELNKPEIRRLVAQIAPRIPFPPPHLFHFATSNTDAECFHTTGLDSCTLFNKMVADAGLILDGSHRILDFGCAVGRIARHWNLPAQSIYGTDYNPTLIRWCKRYLPGKFDTNPLVGRTGYHDGQFDFVYAFSVFSHLAKPAQTFWIQEYSRIIKPQGLLLLTLNGDYFLSQLSCGEREAYERGEMIVWDKIREGTNHCAAFHPVPYVKEKMFDSQFEIVTYIPGNTEPRITQDIYLLRNCG